MNVVKCLTKNLKKLSEPGNLNDLINTKISEQDRSMPNKHSPALFRALFSFDAYYISSLAPVRTKN